MDFFTMINIFSVPKTYDETLNKLAFVNLLVLGVTFFLIDVHTGLFSQAVYSVFQMSIDRLSLQEKSVFLTLFPAGVISFLFTLLFRFIRLHDCISDLFNIRSYFDIQLILKPLADASGIKINKKNLSKLEAKRRTIMGEVFYKYASFNNPQIDTQVVSNSRDHWYWFWIFLETSFIFTFLSFFMLGAAVINSRSDFFSCAEVLCGLSFLGGIFLWVSWRRCKSGAERQVAIIIADATRKGDIKVYLDSEI